MLTELFKGYLSTSLSAAPVMLLLLATAPVLRRRFRAGLPLALWAAVAARLLIPTLAGGTPPIVIPAGEPVFYLERDAAAVTRAFAEAETGAGGTAPLSAGVLSPFGLLAMVWVVGAALCLLGSVAINARSRRQLARWSTPVGDAATLQILEECRRELGIARNIPLERCAVVTTPLLIGLWRPRILLPREPIAPVPLRYALRHELTHYRRRDLWTKLGLLIACSIHWFNPLAWLAAKSAEADMEFGCDADVLRRCSGATPSEYGLSMLGFVRTGDRVAAPFGTGFAPGRKQLLQRFERIADSRCKTRGVPVAAAVLAMILASGALVGCGERIDTDTGAAGEPTVTVQVSAPTETAAPTTPPSEAAGEVAKEAGADPLATESSPDTPELWSELVERSEPADETIYQLEEMEAAFAENPEAGAEMAQAKAEIDEIHAHVDLMETPYDGGVMMWPLPGHYHINSVFGSRFGGADFHTGIDIGGVDVMGADVVSAADGIVAFINTQYTPGIGYGQYIIVDHGGGYTTLYAQLSQITAQPGESLVAGQKIGSAGSTGWSTGPHLHFEVRRDGVVENPEPYLTQEIPETP